MVAAALSAASTLNAVLGREELECEVVEAHPVLVETVVSHVLASLAL